MSIDELIKHLKVEYPHVDFYMDNDFLTGQGPNFGRLAWNTLLMSVPDIKQQIDRVFMWSSAFKEMDERKKVQDVTQLL